MRQVFLVRNKKTGELNGRASYGPNALPFATRAPAQAFINAYSRQGVLEYELVTYNLVEVTDDPKN